MPDGMVSTTVVDTLSISIPPYQKKVLDNWIKASESWVFVYLI